MLGIKEEIAATGSRVEDVNEYSVLLDVVDN
jgi:hypothetical protein